MSQLQIAPDSAKEDIVKPASELSAFINIVQIVGRFKQLPDIEIYKVSLSSNQVAQSYREIPIFLCYRVIRI